jgi:hypothetical protein
MLFTDENGQVVEHPLINGYLKMNPMRDLNDANHRKNFPEPTKGSHIFKNLQKTRNPRPEGPSEQNQSFLYQNTSNTSNPRTSNLENSENLLPQIQAPKPPKPDDKNRFACEMISSKLFENKLLDIMNPLLSTKVTNLKLEINQIFSTYLTTQFTSYTDK